MKLRKLLALILVFAIAIVPMFFASCKKDDENDLGDLEDAEGDLPAAFGDTQKNYSGKKFTVLTHEDRSENQAFNIVDLVVNEELGDEAINKAVEERNTKIKKTNNLKLKCNKR